MKNTALSACLLCALAAPAAADTVFPVRNESALSRSFALPELGQTRTVAYGRSEARVALDWTNEYVNVQSGSESLILDGETQRYSFYYRASPLRSLEFGVELPLLITGGGVLDNTIHGWHEIWGLPDGGRGDAPRNRYLYQYVRDGQARLNVSDSRTGLGDIQLYAGWQALPGLAAHAMIKLPSGRIDGGADQLIGGNTGGALWLDFDPFQGSRRWFGFVSGGVSLNARSEVLPDQQRKFLGFGGAGLAYRIWQPFAVMAQLYAHSPLYSDSNIDALRRMGLQGAFGVRYDLSRCTALNLGFQEDLVTDSSPDFSIHIDVALR
jgi:hypothetical protein